MKRNPIKPKMAQVEEDNKVIHGISLASPILYIYIYIRSVFLVKLLNLNLVKLKKLNGNTLDLLIIDNLYIQF